MFEYHLSYSEGLFYAFAFDHLKHPAGRFKSPFFQDVIDWIVQREGIDFNCSGKFITESWSSL